VTLSHVIGHPFRRHLVPEVRAVFQRKELTLAYMDGGGVLHYALQEDDNGEDEMPTYYRPIAWQYPPTFTGV